MNFRIFSKRKIAEIELDKLIRHHHRERGLFERSVADSEGGLIRLYSDRYIADTIRRH